MSVSSRQNSDRLCLKIDVQEKKPFRQEGSFVNMDADCEQLKSA